MFQVQGRRSRRSPQGGGGHDPQGVETVALYETFGVNQEARYERFLAALNAARAAFRNDKAVMAEIDRFKRHTGRTRKAGDETT
jgi:hypothetical protein